MPSLITFTKGAKNYAHDCMSTSYILHNKHKQITEPSSFLTLLLLIVSWLKSLSLKTSDLARVKEKYHKRWIYCYWKKQITSGAIVSDVDPSHYVYQSFPRDCMIQLICVAKGTGLGLVIRGGANRAEGPMVYVQEIIPGDCQKVFFII